MVSALEARAGGADLTGIVPIGLSAVAELLEAYLDAGFSKFVLRPLVTPTAGDGELARLADAVAGLQT